MRAYHQEIADVRSRMLGTRVEFMRINSDAMLATMASGRGPRPDGHPSCSLYGEFSSSEPKAAGDSFTVQQLREVAINHDNGVFAGRKVGPDYQPPDANKPLLGKRTLCRASGTDRSTTIRSACSRHRGWTSGVKIAVVLKRKGVTTEKVSTSIVSALPATPVDASASAKYSGLCLANYLRINVNDEVKRTPGVGDRLVRPGKGWWSRLRTHAYHTRTAANRRAIA